MNRILGTHPGVPSTVVAFPELHVSDGSHGEQRHLVVQVRAVHWVQVFPRVGVYKGPERMGFRCNPILSSLLIGVVQECAEESGVKMIQDCSKKIFIKLESVGKLLGNLRKTISSRLIFF